MKRKGNIVLTVLAVLVIEGIVMIMGSHDFLKDSKYTHRFLKYGKDTPADFNTFLNSCSDIEHIQMLQALRQLPSFNKAGHIFNAVMDLNMGEIYVNYNDVEPEDVLKAVKEGKIDRADISPSAIRKALLWRGNFKAKYAYYYFDNETVDYHDMVQWAAGEVGVSQEKIDTLSTYQLEKEVSQKYFSSIWEEFTTEQRTKTINALNAKRSWGIKDLKDLGELGKNAYALVKDPKTLYSLGKNMWNLLPGILGYSFAEKDAVCMFIMTVSMIKSK